MIKPSLSQSLKECDVTNKGVPVLSFSVWVVYHFHCLDNNVSVIWYIIFHYFLHVLSIFLVHLEIGVTICCDLLVHLFHAVL